MFCILLGLDELAIALAVVVLWAYRKALGKK